MIGGYQPRPQQNGVPEYGAAVDPAHNTEEGVMYVWVETRDPNFTTIIPAEDIIEQTAILIK